ncbi:MAG TPA: hypothetical protein VN279_12565, partial [Rhodocyclaceae bacterium]|nr:hypothetical protein [Rhodocyclaceae bacterium]
PTVLYIGSGEPVVQHSDNGVAVVAANQYPAGRGLFRWVEGTPLGAALVGPASGSGGANPGAADSCARIAVDPREGRRAWFATHTGLWRREPTTNAFVREPVSGALPAVGTLGSVATDVVAHDNFDPEHPTRVQLIAAIGAVGVFRGVFDRERAPLATAWAGPLGGGILPAPCAVGAMTWDRIRVGVCASQPSHLYVIGEACANNAVIGVWYSPDAGNSWFVRSPPAAAITDLGQIGWYALYVEVHPLNPAIVVIGSLNIYRSTDFGNTWTRILDWLNYDRGDHAQHADQHAALFDSGDPKKLWVANDGGISMAVDIVQGQPLTDRGWRKRSHGINAAMFNDICVHPTYPQMIGGGLQDNGTYVSFGGESWYSVFGGDGGQMSFEVGDPRRFIAPFQGNPPAAAQPPRNGLVLSVVGAASAAFVGGARAPVNADKDPPNDVFQADGFLLENGIAYPAHPSLFVSVVEHHPSSVGRVLCGRANGGAYHSTDFGNNWTFAGFTAAQFGGGDTSAVAFGNEPGGGADWWIGTTQGVVLRGINAPPAATAWTAFNLPAAAGAIVTRIAVHPADDRYVAFCTATTAAGQQGRVFLTLDRGANWAEITGLALVAGPPAPPAGSVAVRLPPGPVTSLAFDPQPGAAASQVLYAGALAGVFAIRNLPRRRPAGAANAPVPGFAPVWARFSGIPTGQPDGPAILPLALVEDLKIVRLPARTGAGVVPNSPESVARTRLMAATFGRGMHACDITAAQPAGVPAGGPEARLYIRQTAIEDGLSYPRIPPATLNAAPAAGNALRLGGDPRFPLNAVRFTDREAFDIRVDHEPFRFFEDVLDPVEFDESLPTKAVAAGEPNVVYVQVHSCGWRPVPQATVHLYFAPSPAPPANPNADPLPDLQADFWANFEADPLPAPAAAPAAPAAAWQRAGRAQTLRTIGPNQPAVARFEWQPPASLGSHVALLALVTTPPGVDPIVGAGAPTVMRTLLRNERRVALRIAPVRPFVPDLYVRDGLDDVGRLAGVAFGGRSPDIIVVPAAPGDPVAEFANLADDRAGDRVRGNGGDNVVYVRVHNRKNVDTAADVELFWALPNALVSAAAGQAGPPFDASKWQVIAPIDAVNVTVPARGNRLARFDFSAAPAPVADFPNAIAFVALIRSHDSADPAPQRAGVDTPDEFWRLFAQLVNSNNAALRAVRYA